jgi:glutamyl-tRNA synthetase
MGITHVVRGEEWISSTPKHLLLFDWLGWERPQFAHMPLLRNTDKSKISKRKNPAARLTWFVEQGYLPEALLNFLGLLGYSLPDSEQEVFTFEQMSESFDWARVNTVGPVFDLDKLLWLNGHYLRALPEDELVRRIVPSLAAEGLVTDPPTPEQAALLAGAAPLVHTRMALLTEAAGLLRFLLVDEAAFALDPAAVDKHLGEGSGTVLSAAADALEPVEPWDTEHVQAAMDAALLEGLGLKRGKAYAPVRVAVCGAAVAPPLPESMALLGKQRTLRRLRSAAARDGG